MSKRKTRKLLHHKRGDSVVIGHLILVGAIIAMSLVWAIWAQSSSLVKENELGKSMDDSVNTLGERLEFMNTFYDSSGNNLTVDLKNCGTVNGITLRTIYLADRFGHTIKTFSAITLINFSGNPIVGQELDRGEQGRLMLSLDGVATSTSYCTLVIVTGRGSTFRHETILSSPLTLFAFGRQHLHAIPYVPYGSLPSPGSGMDTSFPSGLYTSMTLLDVDKGGTHAWFYQSPSDKAYVLPKANYNMTIWIQNPTSTNAFLSYIIEYYDSSGIKSIPGLAWKSESVKKNGPVTQILISWPGINGWTLPAGAGFMLELYSQSSNVTLYYDGANYPSSIDVPSL